MQRAQRFGLPFKTAIASTSSSMKRKEKFAKPGFAKTNMIWTPEDEEKKRKRGERFNVSNEEKKQKIEAV
jgi:hypothetical protein